MSSEAAGVPLTRRNGRLQACEPCRKRKMACDHGFPVCLRCQKRNQTSECVYVMAPLTRDPDQDSGRPAMPLTPYSQSSRACENQESDTHPVKRPKDGHYQGHRDSHGETGRIRAGGGRGGRRRGWASDIPLPREGVPKTSNLFSTPNNFFGPTSFTSVFWENQNQLKPALPPGHTLQETSEQIQKSAAEETEALLNFPIKTSRRLLSRIPTEDTCKKLLQRAFDRSEVWLDFGIEYTQDKLWSTYRHFLDVRSDNYLESLARVLHENAKKPLLESDDSKEWFDSYSGTNLRWESLGLLFCGWLFGTLHPLSTDDLLLLGMSEPKKQLRLLQYELLMSLKDCVNLCGETDTVNSLVVHLLYRRLILTSIINGDTSMFSNSSHSILTNNRQVYHFGATMGILCPPLPLWDFTESLNLHNPRFLSVQKCVAESSLSPFVSTRIYRGLQAVRRY